MICEFCGGDTGNKKVSVRIGCEDTFTSLRT